MYREYRGKRTDNGKWIYGGYFHFTTFNKHFIVINQEIPHMKDEENAVFINEIEVIPETVGQYTGLTDKNGTKIFEGDIMQLCNGTYPCVVYWDGLGWAWKQGGKRREIDLTREKMTIIGNIHDNPELLEEK